MERIILHSDLNNFFASVEMLYNPELRGKPIAVAGDTEKRHGIVLAKNYEAKKFGVKTGNPLWRAKQLCKDIIFVPPHYDLYLKYSNLTREIYEEYTDKVEPYGLDECWLDVTESTNLFGDGKKIADTIRERIKYELGITASIGVSFNKVFAKLGSDLKKPDATTVIEKQYYKETIWLLPASEMLYVGYSTYEKLLKIGIKTIGDLAKADIKYLNKYLGKPGSMLWLFANGLDTSPVSPVGAKPVIKSIGNSTTTPRDLVTERDVKIILFVLAESVSSRLRECRFLSKTVKLWIRDNEMFSYERQGQMITLNRTASAIYEKALELYYKHHDKSKPIRSIGIRASGLQTENYEQMSLSPEISLIQKNENLDAAVDEIRKRFGPFSIQRCIMMFDKELSGINPKTDHIVYPESFFK